MIGVTRFAGAYGSFWRNVTPTIDLFVRRVNIEFYERVDDPCDYQVDPNRSALVAETAFALFDEHSRDHGDRARFFKRFVAQATAEARSKLARLNARDIGEDLNPNELNAVHELGVLRRMLFGQYAYGICQIHIHPKYMGLIRDQLSNVVYHLCLRSFSHFIENLMNYDRDRRKYRKQ